MSRLQHFEKKLDEKLRNALRSRGEQEPTRELLEIHRAILDEIMSRVDVLPRGKRKWSYARVDVSVLTEQTRRRSYEVALIEGDALQRDIRQRFEDEHIELPPHFTLKVHLVDDLPPDIKAKGFDISYSTEHRSETAAHCTLEIVVGTSDQTRYEATGKRVNLGRLSEVLDDQQQFVRRNDIAFADDGDAVNASVSRQHAHIDFDPATGWRIFDDHSKSGTTILRQGDVVRVPSGAGRGVALKSGDEIRLGKARLRFS